MPADSKVVTLELSLRFASFIESVHREHGIGDLASSSAINLPSIALDPGETTGVAEYNGDTMIQVYQKETKEIGPSYDWLYDRLECGYGEAPFDHLRYEDYRIYEWKTADHAWSQVHTLRWIGAIQVAVYKYGTPYSCCIAQHAKGFWSDNKLRHFDLYPAGLKHGRDALRHLLYYICFPIKVD